MKYYVKIILTGVYESDITNIRDVEKELVENFKCSNECFDIEEQVFEVVEKIDYEEN